MYEKTAFTKSSPGNMKTYSRKKCDEQEEVILDLNELCRLCMTKEDELVPIFAKDDRIPFSLRIMACVSLEVSEGDGLPNKICHPCKFQLEKCYNFRKKCENSDFKLRLHLRTLQAKLGAMDMHEADEEDDEEENANPAKSSSSQVQSEDGTNTEQDIVGVTQVGYIAAEPEAEVSDISITLPPEEDTSRDDKTKIKKLDLIDDDNNYYVVDGVGGATVAEEESSQNLADQDLDFIAEAVKSTLASHPDLNLTGALQMKVEQEAGKPTQVSVTTDDGSVIVLELMTEEQDAPPQIAAHFTQDVDERSAKVAINEDGEMLVFKCPQCPKSFARRIQLRRHSSVHMQQRGFSCGICEKWFPTRSALIRHERIHTGERPFQCEVCQKSFAQKEILFRHMMTHTGLKPYNCPHCGKGFSQKEPMRAHMKTHLNAAGVGDVQLHYCTLCPKVFCHASGLSRHLVMHTGKTFKCRVCDKRFNDKSSLRRHIRMCGHEKQI